MGSPSRNAVGEVGRGHSEQGLADAVGPHDNPQLVKNRWDQRRWLAGKYNALYSDKVAVTDSDGGSIAGRWRRSRPRRDRHARLRSQPSRAPCWRHRRLTMRIG